MFLNVRLRAHCHATEDPLRVKDALRFLLPSAKISERRMVGHYGNPIIVCESKADRRGDAEHFWERIKSSIPLSELTEGLKERIDEDCVLHMRLDKQRAYLGKIEIVKHEDVIVVASRIESYPRKRRIAIQKAKEFFKEKR
ncbi:MAG: RNA-binding domain-containing protein [Thermoplasmata archaeon]